MAAIREVVWGYCPLCGAEYGEYCRTIGPENETYRAVQDGAPKWNGKQYAPSRKGEKWVGHDDYRKQLNPLRAAIQRVLIGERR